MENIAKAFVKAQKEFGAAHKTSNNPFFKSKYADLTVVVDAVLGALNNNGIALIQNCHESDTGVVVETIFLHETGETISCGKLSVPAAKNDPQGYGSALTYARRYSLMAACGIAPEDDDGNSATTAYKAQPKQSPKDNFDDSGKVKPGNVTPSVSAQEWEKLDQASKDFLQDIAVEIVAELGSGNIETAHGLFYKADLDQDEKLALWSRLDSKQRSTIKAHQDKLVNGTLPV